MSEKQRLLLNDYLDSFKSLGGTAGATMGAVLVNNAIKDEVVKTLESEFTIPLLNGGTPERALAPLVSNIKKGTTSLLGISETGVRPPLTNVLWNASRGSIAAHLPGDEKMTIVNPIRENAKVLFVVDEHIFDTHPFIQRITPSVCRIS